MAAILQDSAVVTAAVVCTRPRAIPLAMITMGKSLHGFPLIPYIFMGLCFAALRADGAPLLRSFGSLWSPIMLGSTTLLPKILLMAASAVPKVLPSDLSTGALTSLGFLVPQNKIDKLIVYKHLLLEK